MKKPNSLQFVLSAKKILSVNSLYNAKIMKNGAKQYATIYKSGDAKKTETYIKEQVKTLDIEHNHPWVNKKSKFDIVITVIFKSGLLLRDLDNTIKLIQDGIFRALEINDSHVMSIKAYKTLCPDIPEEKICIQLSESTEEPRFDKVTENLPIPERIFLGGTCPKWKGKDWRDELMPELDKIGISYFNPVVKDWTPDCIEIENIEKAEKCDCELYILTPAMKGVYSVAEIINASYEAALGGYGSMLLGILGGKEDWGESMWKSLEATVRLVNEISGGSKRVVGKFINSPIDLLECIGKPKRKRTSKTL